MVHACLPWPTPSFNWAPFPQPMRLPPPPTSMAPARPPLLSPPPPVPCYTLPNPKSNAPKRQPPAHLQCIRQLRHNAPSQQSIPIPCTEHPLPGPQQQSSTAITGVPCCQGSTELVAYGGVHLLQLRGQVGQPGVDPGVDGDSLLTGLPGLYCC